MFSLDYQISKAFRKDSAGAAAAGRVSVSGVTIGLTIGVMIAKHRLLKPRNEHHRG